MGGWWWCWTLSSAGTRRFIPNLRALFVHSLIFESEESTADFIVIIAFSDRLGAWKPDFNFWIQSLSKIWDDISKWRECRYANIFGKKMTKRFKNPFSFTSYGHVRHQGKPQFGCYGKDHSIKCFVFITISSQFQYYTYIQYPFLGWLQVHTRKPE